MTLLNDDNSSTFRLNGETPIRRLGFGAMRVTGDGIWGEHADPDACLATLRRVPELGINFIDTADSYGPTVSEPMLKQALAPYPDDLVIATKGGQVRTGPNRWIPLGRPEYLEQQARMSLRLLGVDRIALWQLHRVDPKVPEDEQFSAIRQMLDDGLIRHAGLSQVTVEQIQAAEKIFPVATVQNRYNIGDRADEDVLACCEERGIGFIPWRPLSGGHFDDGDSALATAARNHDATPAQIALAWLLQRSPVMLPIPGTSRVEHLEENTAAADIRLSEEEINAIGQA